MISSIEDSKIEVKYVKEKNLLFFFYKNQGFLSHDYVVFLGLLHLIL